jgi:protein-S-isoprenylcysteine O-methyltransferase Ste14
MTTRIIAYAFLALFFALDFIIRKGPVAKKLPLGVAYSYRIQEEEKMLVGVFGASYTAYQRVSWRLIPFLW